MFLYDVLKCYFVWCFSISFFLYAVFCTVFSCGVSICFCVWCFDLNVFEWCVI